MGEDPSFGIFHEGEHMAEIINGWHAWYENIVRGRILCDYCHAEEI
jgi:hypothetical protein